jgi:hypothetical protein
MVVVAALVVAAGLPACSSSSGEGDDAARATLTPWERERLDVAEDGTRSLESALRLFSIAFRTKIPGVDAPTGPHELIDATIAVREVEAYREQLTPEQRAAVDRALEPDPDAITFEIPPTGEPVLGPGEAGAAGGGSRSRAAPPPVSRELANAYLEAAATARKRVAAKLGWDYPGSLVLRIGPAEGNYGITWGRWENGAMVGCNTEFNPALNVKAVQVFNTLVHEAVHCFHDSLFPSELTADGAYRNAKWLFEGSAEWIGAMLGGADPGTASWWTNWLVTPRKPLFSREDDAIGFIAHLEETGTEVWGQFRTMWLAAGGGAEAAFRASGADSNRFLDSWASSYLRDLPRGREWDTTGPGIVDVKTPPRHATVGKKFKRTFHVDAYKVGLDRLTVQADVLVITPQGHVRISDGKRDEKLRSLKGFCLRDDGCKCPEETSAPALPKLGRESVLAITGGTSGSSAVVEGEDFDEESCRRQSPRGKHLGVVVTRPAYTQGELYINELDVIDLAACNGPYGRWSGVLRTGGFGLSGSAVDATVVEVPVEFTVDRRGHGHISAHVPGSIDIAPVGASPVGVDAELDVTVSGKGTRISFTGNFFTDLPTTDLPITRTAGESC